MAFINDNFKTATIALPNFTAIGATTTISLHSATGIGCINWFILIGTVWYRCAS